MQNEINIPEVEESEDLLASAGRLDMVNTRDGEYDITQKIWRR